MQTTAHPRSKVKDKKPFTGHVHASPPFSSTAVFLYTRNITGPEDGGCGEACQSSDREIACVSVEHLLSPLG